MRRRFNPVLFPHVQLDAVNETVFVDCVGIKPLSKYASCPSALITVIIVSFEISAGYLFNAFFWLLTFVKSAIS
ncbi:MAG TPA: hypothetical protein ENI33_02680 [Thermoplasmatales archaeon]|nr:hypothetical protein [Thermoplasmatales archaeon]